MIDYDDDISQEHMRMMLYGRTGGASSLAKENLRELAAPANHI
jgi:hypothetical protein